MTAVTVTVTVDRALLNELLADLDAVAVFDTLRFSPGRETWLAGHISGLAGNLERVSGLYDLADDDEFNRIAEEGTRRGHELYRRWLEEQLADELEAVAS